MKSISSIVRALPRSRRVDGWINILTGLGSSITDKVTSTQSVWLRDLGYQELSDMFHSDAVVRKAVTKRPADALAQGIQLSVPEEEGGYDMATEFQDVFDDLRVVPAFYEACVWENLFGGAAIFVAMDDGNYALDAQEQPVNFDRLRSVLWLKVFDCSRIRPSNLMDDQEQDPTSPEFGKPVIYLVDLLEAGQQARVHKDRLIIFPGPMTTEPERMHRQGWGISMLDPAYAALQRNAVAWQSAANAVANAQYVVYKLKGLAHMFSMADGEERAKARARAMELAKGMINAVLVDAEDEYLRENPAFGDLPTMLDQFMLDVASAFDMPATVLWGRSPAGMNATGESDLQLWYSSCKTYQEHHIRPRAQQLVEALMFAKEGPTEGKMLDGWRVTFPPMRVMSELEKADIRSKTSAADEIDIRSGVLMPQEVALNRFRPEGYSIDTQIDRELREQLQQAQLDQLEADMQKADNPPEPAPSPPQGEQQPPPPAPQQAEAV